MPNVTLLRCNILRALYLLLFIEVPIGTAAKLVYSSRGLSAGDGWAVAGCLLAAFALLCGLGLRQPLRMLPVLLLEVLWKTIWLVRVALPLFLAGRIDAALISNSIAIGAVVIMLPVIPWRHVVAEYVLAPAAPWHRRQPGDAVTRLA